MMQLCGGVLASRSKQSLAAWQEEARRKQRCPHCNASEAHSKSVGPAPFATGTPEPREQGQHEAAERECSGRSRGGGQWDASQGERVQRYVAELRGQRVQGGLVGQPSQELLEAEQRLAEVGGGGVGWVCLCHVWLVIAGRD